MCSTLSTSNARTFKAGDIVRHFKWDRLSSDDRAAHKYEYEVICEVQNTEDHSVSVIYRSLFDNQVWSRPAESFYSEVDKNKYPNATQQYRFEKISDSAISGSAIRVPCSSCQNEMVCKYSDSLKSSAAVMAINNMPVSDYLSVDLSCKFYRSVALPKYNTAIQI